MKEYRKAKGTIKVTKDSVRVLMDDDICRYYRWLFTRAHYFTLKTQIPRYGAHINIVSPKLHSHIDCSKAKKYDGMAIEFDYEIEGNYGGFTKGFVNFWLDISSKFLDTIADELGVPPKKGRFARFHLTICNTKQDVQNKKEK